MKKFFYLFLAVLLCCCKKEDTSPPPAEPTVTYHLSHSGMLDGDFYEMDTNSSPALFEGDVLDDFLYRYVNMKVWLMGENLEVDSVLAPAYAFNLEVVVQYSFSELNNEGEMPGLTASKLANAINNGSYAWNDGSEMKEMSVAKHQGNFWTALVGGSAFVITNPYVQATAIGNNSIKLVGGVDSLMIDQGPDARFLTNHQFEYIIPVPQ